MLPSLAARYQPAVTVMNSIVTAFEQNARKDQRPEMPGMPTVDTRPRVRDMQAINDYYFGSHQSVNELMIRMVERMVDHINGKLELGRDGDEEAEKVGNAWRDKAVIGRIDVSSKEDFSIPKPGENGVTFKQVARLIQARFDTDFLSRDRELLKALEELTGFRIDGMSVSDLLQAFVEPDSDEAQKVRSVLSEGLAGQKGSKASQRLEVAVEGPVSVTQAVESALRKEVYEETDDETKAEDIERVASARTQERLDQVSETQDKVAEAIKSEATGGETTQADSAELAAEIIQDLAASVEAEPASETEAAKADDIKAQLEDKDALPLTGEVSDAAQSSSLTDAKSSDALVRAYLEALLTEDEAATRRRWPELS